MTEHTSIEEIVDRILDGTQCKTVFTYPGSPPRHLYAEIIDRDGVTLEQVVREQHLLHLAQARYYRMLARGEKEIPVVIVSGEMGEAMMSQPLLAGSITAPCLVVVSEAMFDHVGSSFSIAHQTPRGTTPAKLGDDIGHLMTHDNIEDRVLVDSNTDIDVITDVIDQVRQNRGVGIIHLPEYAYNQNPELSAVLDHSPTKRSIWGLVTDWKRSSNPVILAGRGAKHEQHRRQIQALATASGAEIVVTMPMEGYFEENYAGRLGTMGDEAANRAFDRSDFVLALGCSLSNVVTSFDSSNIERFQSKVCQVEINADRRSVFASSWVDADLGVVLDKLPSLDADRWFDECPENTVRSSLPENVLALGDVLSEHCANDIIYFGVGNSCIWLPYVLGPEIKKSISRSGSMGEAVGGLACQDGPVIVIGDGEFEMDISLLTEAQYRVERATIFVVNNRRLGLVTERQKAEFGSILTPKDNVIQYEDLGAGFKSVESYSASSPETVKQLSEQALKADEISVVEIKVEAELTDDIYSLFELPGIDT